MIYSWIKSRLIAIVFLVGFLPRLIAGFAYPGANEFSINANYEKIQIQLTQILGIFLLLSLLFIYLEDLRQKKLHINLKIYFLLPFLSLTLLQSFKRDSFVLQTTLQFVIYLVIFLGSHSGGWRIFSNLKFIVFFALASEISLGLYIGSSAWRPCRVDKCLTASQSVFTGQFATGNSASVLFGFLAVISIMVFQNSTRIFLVSLLTLFTLISGGRSPLISIMLCLVVVFIRNKGLRKALMVVVLLISFTPVLYQFPDNFLTFRGYLWNSTRDFLLSQGGYSSSVPFTKFIQTYVSHVPRTTESPHNLWLGIWWDSGVIGILLFIPFLFNIVFKLAELQGNLFVILLYFMALNITEPISSFYHFDSYSWILLVLLLFWSNTRRSRYET